MCSPFSPGSIAEQLSGDSATTKESFNCASGETLLRSPNQMAFVLRWPTGDICEGWHLPSRSTAAFRIAGSQTNDGYKGALPSTQRAGSRRPQQFIAGILLKLIIIR
jgi:hypothetical protein